MDGRTVREQALSRADRQRLLAKHWAKRNGFAGEPGGWIRNTATGKPVVQGWSAFYWRYRDRIWAAIAE